MRGVALSFQQSELGKGKELAQKMIQNKLFAIELVWRIPDYVV